MTYIRLSEKANSVEFFQVVAAFVASADTFRCGIVFERFSNFLRRRRALASD